ncbi:hypothetical protein NliqN6_4885 [Naganishia liquefaciens]|uniref:Uncharacterized protein n=1 Tax=Naganishia liquefaciens TaxID=104408 RepID=A0A8H3TWP8_9TREE|nr:hypothetical protein NliqN6_4885 [Naganishia liquefaciens]
MAAVLPAIPLAGFDGMPGYDPGMLQPTQAVHHFQQLSLPASASDVSMMDLTIPLSNALTIGEGPWPMDQDTDYLPLITALLNMSNQHLPGDENPIAVSQISSATTADIAATILQRSYQRGYQEGQRLANTDREAAERLVQHNAYMQGVVECIREAEVRFLAVRDQIALLGYREGWIHGGEATLQQVFSQAMQAVQGALEQIYAHGRSRGIEEGSDEATRDMEEQRHALLPAETANQRAITEHLDSKIYSGVSGTKAEARLETAIDAQTTARQTKVELEKQAQDYNSKILAVKKDLETSKQELQYHQLANARELGARQIAIEDLTTHIIKVHAALDESRSTIRQLSLERDRAAREITNRHAELEQQNETIRELKAVIASQSVSSDRDNANLRASNAETELKRLRDKIARLPVDVLEQMRVPGFNELSNDFNVSDKQKVTTTPEFAHAERQDVELDDEKTSNGASDMVATDRSFGNVSDNHKGESESSIAQLDLAGHAADTLRISVNESTVGVHEGRDIASAAATSLPAEDFSASQAMNDSDLATHATDQALVAMTTRMTDIRVSDQEPTYNPDVASLTASMNALNTSLGAPRERSAGNVQGRARRHPPAVRNERALNDTRPQPIRLNFDVAKLARTMAPLGQLRREHAEILGVLPGRAMRRSQLGRLVRQATSAPYHRLNLA